MKKVRLFIWITLFLPGFLVAQDNEEKPQLPTQTGFKLGWALEIPAINRYQGQQVAMLRSGNRFNFSVYQNIPLTLITQFQPSIGINYTFFQKSNTYPVDCTLDSFPTFWNVADTIPGRDIRFWSLTLEPAFKFYVVNWNVHLRFSPVVGINLQTKYENYAHSCGQLQPRSFIDWNEEDNRSLSKVTVGLSGGIVKEVRLNAARWLALETGFHVTINPVLQSRSAYPTGPKFDLNLAGVYLNIGFFRRWVR